MQKQVFSKGGFVLHKVYTFNRTTKFSAWYDGQGNLLDMDRNDGRKPSKLDLAKAKRLGQIWR